MLIVSNGYKGLYMSYAVVLTGDFFGYKKKLKSFSRFSFFGGKEKKEKRNPGRLSEKIDWIK